MLWMKLTSSDFIHHQNHAPGEGLLACLETFRMSQTACLSVVETPCQPMVCKSAHQRTVICVTCSSFVTVVMIKRSLTHLTLDKVILIILCTPGQHANPQFSAAVTILSKGIISLYNSIRDIVCKFRIIFELTLLTEQENNYWLLFLRHIYLQI